MDDKTNQTSIITSIYYDEEEDVVLEGSDLHQALLDMGYTDFDPLPRIAEGNTYKEREISKKHIIGSGSIREHVSHVYWFPIQTLNSMYQNTVQDKWFERKHLETISKAKILLDDHAVQVNELLDGYRISKLRTVFEFSPLIGSFLTTIFYTGIKRNEIAKAVGAFSVLGYFAYNKIKQILIDNNLECLIALQNELHDMCKQSLKILRRTHGKKSIVTGTYEKFELLGHEKNNIIISIENLLIEIYRSLSQAYYCSGIILLEYVPDPYKSNCTPTPIDTVCKLWSCEITSYDDLKSLYYTFILAQSELMFVLANCYRDEKKTSCLQLGKNISYTIKKLIESVSFYWAELSKALQEYQSCKIQPIQRVFKGIPTSKWQDSYLHLELTSQRIQLAYKEISSILELIDLHGEKDEDDLQFVVSITDKINEAYKQIENARSFAEFTSLLIAKAQKKPMNDSKSDKNEDLFPIDDDKRTVVFVDKEAVIEDEVFEEYIREEYLKPLYESSDGDFVQNFRLDKLLEKSFMSELKEALIEKQKSITERELKALKRMYDKVQRDSEKTEGNVEKTNNDGKSNINNSLPSRSLPPVPPLLPPPSPPPLLMNTINEISDSEDEKEVKNGKTPVPLPRFKMLRPEDEIPDVQRFSISDCTPQFRFPSFKASEETFLRDGKDSEKSKETECTPNFRFPPLKLTEETFLGSGENSEEEENDGNIVEN